MKLIPIKNACQQVGVSRTKLWQMVKEGDFPRPINISGSRKGFIDHEIESWIESRIQERDEVAL